jgi:proteasome accessory factor A
MKRRIQGTEHEYTLFSQMMYDRGFDPHQLALQAVHESDLQGFGEFLVNGSRAYLDVGHFELSTCETSNAFDLLKWEKAGEKIVDWARKSVEERQAGEGRRIWAYKNNTSPDGTSYGSHENYLLDRSVDFPERLLVELVPHLASRMIYTGAGDILEGRYVLSPSAYLTSHVISGNTMHGTGIINTRDETHGDPGRWRRLHLIVGDALMNENAILLRNWTTTGILQLIEEGKLKDAPRLEDPLRDMWNNIEQTNPEKWSFALKDGRKVSPIDIQRYYLGKLEGISDGKRDRQALRLLERVLGLLERRKTREAAHLVEWVDRYLAIQEHAGKDEKGGPEAEMTACKRYSELSEGRSLYHERVRRGLVDRQLSDAEILKAITAPPPDTRAALRSKILDGFEVRSMDWSRVTIREGQHSREIWLNDPFESDREAV